MAAQRLGVEAGVVEEAGEPAHPASYGISKAALNALTATLPTHGGTRMSGFR